MKNLQAALEACKKLNGRVEFNIYGPIEDTMYWERCKRIIRDLPISVSVNYQGILAHDNVHRVMHAHHLLLLPTLGENFGHVILEALSAGRPVLISDRTPWRGLRERGIGWDLPLDRPDLFELALQQCVDMEDRSYKEMCARALVFCKELSRDSKALSQNRLLFSYQRP